MTAKRECDAGFGSGTVSANWGGHATLEEHLVHERDSAGSCGPKESFQE